MRRPVKIVVWGVSSAAFVGYMVLVAGIFRYTMTPPAEVDVSTIMPPIEERKVSSIPKKADVPATLSIPRLKINVALNAVGLSTTGEMDVRKSPKEVSWYKRSARPGNAGSAVVAGHYGWKDGQGAIFNNLHTLKKGDILSVTDKQGNKTKFIVRRSQSYNPDADASTIFQSNDGKSHLNLITCEGEWSNERQTYSSRLVVFTDKI